MNLVLITGKALYQTYDYQHKDAVAFVYFADGTITWLVPRKFDTDERNVFEDNWVSPVHGDS